MKGVKKVNIVILIFLINFATCMLVRCCHGGRLKVVDSIYPDAEHNIYCIAGMLNQADSAYRFIDLPSKYHEIDMNFSMLGFNPGVSGTQLYNLMKEGDAVVGISIGAKAIACSQVDVYNKVILVNPCTYPKILKPELRKAITWLSPIAELISYSLGWIAVLPIIPGDMDNQYSIALLVDQLYWMGHFHPRYDNINNIGVVISTKDEFLLNDEILHAYAFCDYVEIDTMHGRTGDIEATRLYSEAIKTLLE